MWLQFMQYDCAITRILHPLQCNNDISHRLAIAQQKPFFISDFVIEIDDARVQMNELHTVTGCIVK